MNFGLDVAPPSLHPVITLFSPKHCEGDAGFSNQNRFKPVMSRKEKKRKGRAAQGSGTLTLRGLGLQQWKTEWLSLTDGGSSQTALDTLYTYIYIYIIRTAVELV